MSRAIRSRASPDALHGLDAASSGLSSVTSNSACESQRPNRRSTETCGGSGFQTQAQNQTLAHIQRQTQIQIHMTVIQ